MKRTTTTNLITRQMRREWFAERKERHDALTQTVTNPQPCDCGSGELAKYPNLDDPGKPFCIVCIWERD